MTTITLTDEQRAAIKTLLSFPKQVQTLGGLAGTGKSYLVSQLIQELPDFSVVAYTGKASDVLRRKGVNASTIHSLVYIPEDHSYEDEWGNLVRDVRFRKKEKWEVPCKGFIVDEASMVSREIHDVLVGYGRPIIYVGDHGQLEPIQSREERLGEGAFNLMAKPDICLEQIHRNSGEIARFSYFIRMGGVPSEWVDQEGYTGDQVRIMTFQELCSQEVDEDDSSSWVGNVDQMICALNKTRVTVNQMVREIYGYLPNMPVVGDRVVCLQNKHALGLFNGMQGDVIGVGHGTLRFVADDQEYEVRYVPESFNGVGKLTRDRDKIPFDYAYCCTAHKYQGSETDSVLVFEQGPYGWDHCRWCYTAASRARKRLTWVTGIPS